MMGRIDRWASLFVAWVTATVATLAALYIGEVLGQEPCLLCWYQRIFMFPLAAILLIAILREDFEIWRYALPLASVGGLIAAWHTLQYVGLIPKALEPCTGTGPSCSGAEMTILGGIPIPLLALIAFGVIAIALDFTRRADQP